MSAHDGVAVDVHLTPADQAAALRDDVRRGLLASPKELPPKWFYDDRGSQLFDAITRLPEYYPTRAERAILAQRATQVAELTGADTLVELGSGTSEKTRLLLDALRDHGSLRRFVPFDVSEGTLRAAAEAVREEYPGTSVHAIVGDFERHLGELPGGGTRLIAFLGGTIGNLRPAQRSQLLGALRAGMSDDDALLIGAGLVKDEARMVAAYDDASGVTAEFNRNVLHVVNRELGADFDAARFEHVARWNADDERIEMWLRSTTAQRVTVAALDLSVDFAEDEAMRTELSAKFRIDALIAELGTAGLRVDQMWTGDDGDFSVTLARPVRP